MFRAFKKHYGTMIIFGHENDVIVPVFNAEPAGRQFAGAVLEPGELF